MTLRRPAHRRRRMQGWSGRAWVGVAVVGVALGVALAGDIAAEAETPGVTTRESVADTTGAQANAASANASVSADGRVVAFDSAASNLVAGDANGVRDVFVRTRADNRTGRVSIPPAGGQFPGPSRNPSVSADGNRVAFEVEKAEPTVTGAVRPDRLLFVSAGDVFVMREDGTAVENLTGTGATEDDPRFSPDGRQVAFTRYRSATASSIWVMNADGTGAREVVPDGGVINRQPAWSPEGTRLVFSRVDGPLDEALSYSLWIADLAEDTETQLTDPTTGEGGDGFDSDPDWSPTGSEAVFSATRFTSPGVRRLYVVDVDEGTERTLFGGDGDDTEPRWSRDGEHVVFSSGGEIWQTQASGGDDVFPLTDRGGTSPTLRGDGRRIAFVRGTELFRMAAAGEIGGDAAVSIPTGLQPAVSQPDYEPSRIGTGSPIATTATVVGGAGAATPSGSVSFFLCSPREMGSFDRCQFGGRRIGAPVRLEPVPGSSPPAATAVSPGTDEVTPPVAFNPPGTWCWRVEYLGDALYLPAEDDTPGSQCFEVSRRFVTATVETEVSEFGFNAFAEFFSGAVPPDGLATFYLCGPDEAGGVSAAGCVDGGERVGEPVPTEPNSGTVMHASSEIVLPAGEGRYCWRVEYSGSGEHQPATATGPGSAECFTVGGRAAPRLTAVSDPTGRVTAGTEVRNRATLTFGPSISLTKTGPDSAAVDEEIEYQFTITNTGARPLDNISLVDEQRFDDGSTETRVQETFPDDEPLLPGESIEFTFPYTVTQEDVDRGSIRNDALVVATDPDDETVRAFASHTVTFGQVAALQVQILAPETFDPDTESTVEYRIDVINTGTVTLRDVTVRDDRGSSQPVIPATEIPPGESQRVIVTYPVTQDDIDAGNVDNVAVARGTGTVGGADIPVDDRAVHQVRVLQRPEVQIEKSGPASAAVDETITYTFLVTNTGNVTLTDVVVIDERIVQGEPVMAVDVLAPGNEEGGEVQYTVTAADGERIDNTAVVTADHRFGTVDASDSHTVAVGGSIGAVSSPQGASGGTDDPGVVAGSASTALPLENLPERESTEVATGDPTGATGPEASLEEVAVQQAPGGMAVFYLCGPTQVTPHGCLTGGTQVGPAVAPPDEGGEFESEVTLDTLTEGVHCWRAEYGGDDTHVPVSYTDADDMCFEVFPPFTGNATTNVYVRDRTAGTTTLVSVGLGGAPANGSSREPSISGAGTRVAFTSDATNLSDDDVFSFVDDVFVRDLAANATRLVSTYRDGCDVEFGAAEVREGVGEVRAQDEHGLCFPAESFQPAISANGRFVAFASYGLGLNARNPVTGDPFGLDDFDEVSHVYVRDLTTGRMTVESVNNAGLPGNRESGEPGVSDDGGRVVFTSSATNLQGGDTNNASDIFLRDRTAGGITRVSVSTLGQQADLVVPPVFADIVFSGPSSFEPVISADGRTVAFASQASNLVPEDTNWACLSGGGSESCGPAPADVFVRDLRRGTTVRASVNSDAQQAAAGSDSRRPSISAEGRYVAFDSNADNLVSQDTNGRRDVFVRDRIPVLALSPDPAAFAPRIVGAAPSAPITVVAINNGSGPVHLEALAVTDGDVSDFVASDDTCTGATLHRGEICTVQIRFAPTVEGAREALLTVTSTDPAGPRSVRLTGTGVQAAGALSPNHDFGEQRVGTESGPRVVTLTSTGTADLSVASVTLEGAHPGDFTLADDCTGRTLAPTSGCGITVTFRPTATGTRTATVVVTDNGIGSPRAVALTGIGFVPDLRFDPVLTLELQPDPLDFGVVPVDAERGPRSVTVRNTGTGVVSVASAELQPVVPAGADEEAPGDFAVAEGGDACSGASLAPGETCEVGIVFAPLETGAHQVRLAISSDAEGSPHTVAVVGLSPLLEPNPPLAKPGFVTFVEGSHFPPDTEIELTWSPGLGRVLVTSDAEGSFRAPMLVMRRDQLGPRLLIARGLDPAGEPVEEGEEPQFEIETDFLVVPGSAQPGDFTTRR